MARAIPLLISAARRSPPSECRLQSDALGEQAIATRISI
jgi:hypothetical protein